MLYFNDVSLKASSHTLSEASEEHGVSKNLIYHIFRGIVCQLMPLTDSYKMHLELLKKDPDTFPPIDKMMEELRLLNPPFPQVLYEARVWLRRDIIQESLSAGLLKKEDSGYSLSDLSIKVFERAAYIENMLEEDEILLL